MTISLEEHVARALWRNHSGGMSWESILHPATEARFMRDARAAIAAVREREGAESKEERPWIIDHAKNNWDAAPGHAPDPAEVMRAKWEKLERATQPFRSVFETYPVDRFPDSEIVSIKVTFGDLRELAAALKGNGEG